MREEVLREVARLLAEEMKDEGDDLDCLETQVVQMLRQVGRQTLQEKVESKKRATAAAGSPVPAGERPAS